jgi:flagellar biosynthesis/type III secretory pathway M-ring protein FliF/YscJ
MNSERILKEKAELEVILARVTQMVEKHPEKAAIILTDWIHKQIKKAS